MAASPWHLAHLDVARQDAAPHRLRALAAFCDADPDDEARAGAVNSLRPITGGRALYDGADRPGALDDLSDETADHDPRPHVVDARGHLAKVRVAGSSPVVRSKKVLVRRDALRGSVQPVSSCGISRRQVRTARECGRRWVAAGECFTARVQGGLAVLGSSRRRRARRVPGRAGAPRRRRTSVRARRATGRARP
jgi:hypothetical protein